MTRDKAEEELMLERNVDKNWPTDIEGDDYGDELLPTKLAYWFDVAVTERLARREAEENLRIADTYRHADKIQFDRDLAEMENLAWQRLKELGVARREKEEAEARVKEARNAALEEVKSWIMNGEGDLDFIVWKIDSALKEGKP